MMYIEGHWERVSSLEDVVRVVREYYNDELADKIEGLITISDFERERLDELEMVFQQIRDIVY